MRTIRIAAQVYPQQGTWAGLRAAAIHAERLSATTSFTQFTLGFNGPDWALPEGEPWLRWRDQRNASS